MSITININDHGKEPRKVTICVLTYGNYEHLARRCLQSVIENCDRSLYRLMVGANAVSDGTKKYLQHLFEEERIDALYMSEENINKSPMMSYMFRDVSSEFIWWFDDDSYITRSNVLNEWLHLAQQAPASTVMWGHRFFFNNENDFNHGMDVRRFVTSASWYRGKNPPSWEPGGKGEYNFEGKGTGDGRWFFITGGCWLIRTDAIKKLDWPDKRLIKRSDDIFLCEAIRQQDWNVQDIGSLGVQINSETTRGTGEDAATMQRQVNG